MMNIEQAYRMKATRLNDFIELFDGLCMAELSTRVMQGLINLPDARVKEYLTDWGVPEAEQDPVSIASRGLRFDILMEVIKQADSKDERDMQYGFECGLIIYLRTVRGLWGSTQYAYVVPYGETWIYRYFRRPTYAAHCGEIKYTVKENNINDVIWDNLFNHGKRLVHSTFKADNGDNVLALRRESIKDE